MEQNQRGSNICCVTTVLAKSSWKAETKNMDFWREMCCNFKHFRYSIVMEIQCNYLKKVHVLYFLCAKRHIMNCEVKEKVRAHLCLWEFFFSVHQESDVARAHLADQAQLAEVGWPRVVAILPRQVLLGHLLRVEPPIVSYATRQVLRVLGTQHYLHVLLHKF